MYLNVRELAYYAHEIVNKEEGSESNNDDNNSQTQNPDESSIQSEELILLDRDQ